MCHEMFFGHIPHLGYHSSIAFRPISAARPPPRRSPPLFCAWCARAGALVGAGAVCAPSLMGGPVKQVFQHRELRSAFRHALREVDRRRMFAAYLSPSGGAWLLSVRVARLSGAHRLRVRRQAPASARGQRHGCQHHAWSKTIPERRSDKMCSNATRLFGELRARHASSGTASWRGDTGGSPPSGHSAFLLFPVTGGMPSRPGPHARSHPPNCRTPRRIHAPS